MKRVILSLTAVAVVAVVFTACKPELTLDEMLTNKKGWKLVEATSAPAYELSNGSKINSLFDGYLEAWELDDILFFKEDGALTIDPGKVLPPEGKSGWTTAKTIGTWAWQDDTTKIRMQIPFWYPATEGGVREPDVLNKNFLDKETLKLSLTFTEDETGERYTFALTYTAVK